MKKSVAGLTAFFLMLGGLFAGLDFALSTAHGAPAGPVGDPANSSWGINLGPLAVGRGAGSTYTASVTVRDVSNDVVPGEVVRIDSVPSGVTFPAGQTCTTDAAGECSVDVYSTVARTFDFTAWLGADQIGASESREWYADAMCVAASGCTPEPGVDAAHTTRVEVTENGALFRTGGGIPEYNLVTAYAYDMYGNPVSNVFVTASPRDPGMTFRGGLWITGLDGVAVMRCWASLAGAYLADVTMEDRRQTPSSSTVELAFSSYEVDASNVTLSVFPTGPIQVGQDYTVSANVIGTDSNPVTGAFVVFDFPANVSFDRATCITDSSGACDVSVTSLVAGSYEIGARAVHLRDQYPMSPVTVDFIPGSGWPANSSWVINQSGPLTVGADAGATYTATTIVRDVFNNVVPGEVVRIDSVPSGVTFPAGQKCTTDAAGECSVDVYSTVAGVFDFTAWLDAGQIGTSESRQWSAAPVAPAAPRVDTANGTEVAGGAGSSEPGATIEVTWPDASTSTTTVNPDGSWSIPTPAGVGSGEISVTVTTAAGSTSGETKWNLDTDAPTAPRVDTANGTVVSGGAGSSEPGATIEVAWPDGSTSSTTVNPDGSWSIATPGGMSSGEITVTATDLAGNKSGEVKGDLVTRGPSAPVLNPSDGETITGRAEPGSTITITDKSGNPVVCKEGVVVAGADGSFRCTLVTPLSPGSAINVVATDKAGNASSAEEVEITLLGISADFGVRESGQSQTVVGTGFVPGETVSLDFCSTCSCVGTGIADADGKVVITFEIPEGAHPGSHTLRLTGDQSGPYKGSVEMTFVVAAKADASVKVDTGGYVTASDGSDTIVAGVSGLAVAILLLVWGVNIIGPTLRKKNVGA